MPLGLCNVQAYLFVVFLSFGLLSSFLWFHLFGLYLFSFGCLLGFLHGWRCSCSSVNCLSISDNFFNMLLNLKSSSTVLLFFILSWHWLELGIHWSGHLIFLCSDWKSEHIKVSYAFKVYHCFILQSVTAKWSPEFMSKDLILIFVLYMAFIYGFLENFLCP